MEEKYSWFNNHSEEFAFTVCHKEDGNKTLIAITDSAEKAHFISTSCNQFLYEDEREQNNGAMLNELKKANEVLFTTEDGVPIHEGDHYYAVRDFNLNGRCNGLGWYNPKSGEKYFSTKSAAEDWILYNKPCLSFNDIKQHIDTWKKREMIIELAKSKL